MQFVFKISNIKVLCTARHVYVILKSLFITVHNKDINALFLKVNNKLHKTNQWFISNKLSLDNKKTNYLFFHKQSKQDDIPFLLSKPKINNYEFKFIVILLDENLTWKLHIKYIENKIAKNIGSLFKAKSFLNKQSLLSLYYIKLCQCGLGKYIYDKL